MHRDELLAEAERRGNTYKLLSECYQTPDEELVSLLEDVESADWRLDADQIHDQVPDDLESLRVDYAKLFVGPFEVLAPPYGSVYLENADRVMTESTIDVMNRYQSVGLDTEIDEPADHVAAELEFMYALIVREVEAIANDEYETAREYLERQRSFLHDHLGAWIDDFTAAVEENTETAFYEHLARETKAFVGKDGDRIANRISVLED